MFDSLVGILQIAYYIILFIFIPLMFIMRFLIVKDSKNPVFHRVLIVIDITSLSYFLFFDQKHPRSKLYNTLMIVFAVFGFLALALGVHMLV